MATAGCIFAVPDIIVTILARLYLKYRNSGSVTGRTEVLKTGSGSNDRIGRNTDPQRCILGKWGVCLTATEWSMVVIFGICVLLLRKKLNPIWVMVLLAGVMKVGISMTIQGTCFQ